MGVTMSRLFAVAGVLAVTLGFAHPAPAAPAAPGSVEPFRARRNTARHDNAGCHRA